MSAEWAGCTREQARERDPAWYREWVDGAVEGYPGGETYLELHRRSVRAFQRILEAADGRTAVVVCHGGNIRAIVSEVVGLGADQRWRIAAVANCSLTAIERRRGRVTLVTFNDTGHLRLDCLQMEDYTSRYKGEAVEIALFGGEYQDGILTAYCLIEDVAHVELNGHILVPLQNVASLHCTSRCDAQDDWPPRGLFDDEREDRDDDGPG